VIQNFRGGVWQKSSTPFLMHNFFPNYFLVVLNFKIIFHNLHLLLICAERQLQFPI
jgi:hypothetical protein